MSEKLVRGDLRVFTIFDLTQSLMMGRKTAEVRLQSGERQGFVHFVDGQIVSALDDSLRTGEKAAANLFAWRSGTFTVDFGKRPPETNISIPTDYLLLEVARNLDEVRRDRGIGEGDEEDPGEIEADVDTRMRDKLREQLNIVFKRVSETVEPSRARYTARAFDGHLAALEQHGGSVLFLQDEQRPRVRTPSGFTTLDEAPVEGQEIEGFLSCILSEAEQRMLLEHKEITLFHATPGRTFRLHVATSGGRRILGFSPALRDVPDLGSLVADESQQRRLDGLRSGLVVVAGPLGSGKGALTASIVQGQMRSRGAFGVLFSDAHAWRFDDERGFCVVRGLPPPGPGFHRALVSALEQGPDILGIAGTTAREALRDAFHVALGAAGGDRLVIYELDGQSPLDTITRILRLARTADGDPLWDPLARSLQLVVDLEPGGGTEPRITSILEIDARVRGWLLHGDLDALKTHRLTHATA